MNDSLLLLLIVSAGVGFGLAVWSMAKLGAGLARKRGAGGPGRYTWDDELAKRLPLPLGVIAGVLGTAVALNLYAAELDPRMVVESRRAIAVLFILAGAWAVLHLLRMLLDRATRQRVRLQPAARVSGRVLSIALYALAFLTVLSQYGISVTPLLTGLGIAALAVALALQDTLANFFAGIWIQTGRSMQPGHFVRLEPEKDKLEGFVEEVGWRVTRIRTLAGNTIVIPNAQLAQATITDFNLPSPDLAVSMEFRAGLETDPAHICAILTEEANAVQETHKGMVASIEPFAQMSAIGDFALHYTLSFRATEYTQQFSAQQEIRMRVLQRFRKEGVRIPYPTQHMIQEPVDPPATRVPTAPGGFSPADRRPPRPRHVGPVAKDPREAEAEKAKGEIAAKQAEEGKAAAARDDDRAGEGEDAKAETEAEQES